MLLRYFGIHACLVDFRGKQNEGVRKRKLINQKWVQMNSSTSGTGFDNSGGIPDGEDCVYGALGLAVYDWLKHVYFQDVSNQWLEWCNSAERIPDANTNTVTNVLPPLYFQHSGHSRTIVGMYMYKLYIICMLLIYVYMLVCLCIYNVYIYMYIC